MLQAKCTFGKVELRNVAHAQLLPMLPQMGYFAVVGAAPSSHKIIVDIDASLASWSIERLLAGDGKQAAQMQRQPTELELGVLSFLLLQVLQFFGSNLEGGQELVLTLDRLLGTSAALAPLLGEDTDYVQLGLRLQLDGRAGYVRLLLPASLVTGFFGTRIGDQHTHPEELALVRRCLEALPQRRIQARVIGARLQLSKEEIANVDVGDIIILENHQLKWTPELVTGNVDIRIGNGRNGGLEARLYDDLNETRLEITRIIVQHHAEGAPMAEHSETNEQANADNLGETEGLLRDVDASVAVELGRLHLTTAQIVRLRTGQVLRLARAAQDPVDLVVGGKLFARGDLIEVDGELGVRLTHVTGTP